MWILYLPGNTLKELDSPEWEARSKCHDWKGYVPSELISAWSELTRREKVIIAYLANLQADAEEWD